MSPTLTLLFWSIHWKSLENFCRKENYCSCFMCKIFEKKWVSTSVVVNFSNWAVFFTFNCLILNVRCIHFLWVYVVRIFFWISLFKDTSCLSSSMYIHMRWLYLESKKMSEDGDRLKKGNKVNDWFKKSRRDILRGWIHNKQIVMHTYKLNW